MKKVFIFSIGCLLLWLACGGDSESPTVQITSPADGSLVSGIVAINVDAADNKEVDSVQIYIDADLAATDTTEPYSYAWNTDSMQQDSSFHNLLAKAYDLAENEGISDTVYVTVYNDTLSGNLRWRTLIGLNSSRSSPAIGPDGTIYAGSDDHYLWAINVNSTIRWRFQTSDWIYSSPAIGSDGTIYVGSHDYNLYAINPNGTLKWSYPTGNIVLSSPAIGSDGTIYVGSNDHNLYAINPDGSLKWTFPTGSVVNSSPAIGADGTIYVGSYDNNLYAINPVGTLKWSYPTNDFIFSSPAIGNGGMIRIIAWRDHRQLARTVRYMLEMMVFRFLPSTLMVH